MIPGEILALIEEIRRDNTSGAVGLSRRAAIALSRLSALHSRDPRSTLEETARALVAAQPTMAPIFNLANRVLSEVERRRATVASVCDDFLRALAANQQAAVRHGARLPKDGSTVVTHSRSETVLEILSSAFHAGRRFRVVCTESRPLGEGVTAARELGQIGIPVTLVVDAAMLAALEGADLVLVGADSVSEHRLVNKMGTSLLAAAAAGVSAPFYAACGSEKLSPPGLSTPPESSKDAHEVADFDQDNVRVENLYFDRTPLDRLTGIITEDGILRPVQIRQRLQHLSVHPALAIRRNT